MSGLSGEGSIYDSEEDRKALKVARKKRKAEVTIAKAGSKKQRSNVKKWTVCPESVALADLIQCLGSLCQGICYILLSLFIVITKKLFVISLV